MFVSACKESLIDSISLYEFLKGRHLSVLHLSPFASVCICASVATVHRGVSVQTELKGLPFGQCQYLPPFYSAGKR